MPLLSVSDVFLLPSAQESFGLAALEAMACEVPVVASSVGGLPEVIEHGVSGFLHPLDALDEMAASAIALLTDSERHRTRRGRRMPAGAGALLCRPRGADVRGVLQELTGRIREPGTFPTYLAGASRLTRRKSRLRSYPFATAARNARFQRLPTRHAPVRLIPSRFGSRGTNARRESLRSISSDPSRRATLNK